MSIMLELPEELKSELAGEADELGLSLSEYIVRLLSTARALGNHPKTGTELIDYWQAEGLIGTRPDITDSQTHARRLREQAERRNLS